MQIDFLLKPVKKVSAKEYVHAHTLSDYQLGIEDNFYQILITHPKQIFHKGFEPGSLLNGLRTTVLIGCGCRYTGLAKSRIAHPHSLRGEFYAPGL